MKNKRGKPAATWEMVASEAIRQLEYYQNDLVPRMFQEMDRRVPVVYADWEWHSEENKAPVLRCTACKSPAFCTLKRDNLIEFARTPYCSSCGARMKKGK